MEHNPYAAPTADTQLAEPVGGTPAGFWIRAGASIIDTILMMLITFPLAYAIYGQDYFTSESFVQGIWDILLSYVLPFIAVILFWVYRAATPGKIVLGLKIVRADNGDKCSTAQLIGRYFGYYLSAIPLGLGFIWVAFDKRKRGWHDMVSGTAVVRDK